MRTIDIAVANAFMCGVDKTIRNTRIECDKYGRTVTYRNTKIECDPNVRTVTYHNTPIVVWDAVNSCLYFSLHGYNTQTTRNRINGIMTYLHQKLILPRSWLIRMKRGVLQVVESKVFDYPLALTDIVTISHVYNLAQPNNRAELINIGPDIPYRIIKECEVQASRIQKQKAAFLTFDDLSGVC